MGSEEVGSPSAREALVLLHGFAGTGGAWDDVIGALGPARYRPIAPDLRGHGSAGRARPISFAACASDVLDAAPGRFALAGYSLGGRVALHVALEAPERVTRLVLVATTAGLEDPASRAERRRADHDLAAWAEHADREAWIRRWTAQPIFAGTPPEAAARWERDLRCSDPADLAAVLRGIGTGEMTPLWDRLPELTMPVDVVVGERDAKFTALGRRLAAALPRARLAVVPGAGHGLPREAPAALAGILEDASLKPRAW
jgi:2-succinyl-6-hydroxy-2,4-cyclohexadiene-1-carboxylate synthase